MLVDNLKYFTPNEQVYIVYKYFFNLDEQQICKKLGVNWNEMEIVKIEVGERLNYIFNSITMSARGRDLLKQYKEHPFALIDVGNIDKFVWDNNISSRVGSISESEIPIKAEANYDWAKLNRPQIIGILHDIEKNEKLYKNHIQLFTVFEQAIMNFLLGINGFEKYSPMQICSKISVKRFVYFCDKLNVKFEMLVKQRGAKYRKMITNLFPTVSKATFEEYCAMQEGERKAFDFNIKDEDLFTNIQFVLKNLTHFSVTEQYILLSLNGLNGFKQKTKTELIQEWSDQGDFSKKYKIVKNIMLILQQGPNSKQYNKVALRNFPVITPKFYEEYKQLSLADKLRFVSKCDAKKEEDLTGKIEFIAKNLEVLLQNMNHLTPTEQFFVCNVFGLNGFEKKSRAEIREKLKWDSSAFSLCKKNVSKKLEVFLSEERDTDFAKKILKINYPIVTIENYKNLLQVNKFSKGNTCKISFEELLDMLNSVDNLNQNLQYFSPHEQYIVLRMLGINGFEAFSKEEIEKSIIKFSKTLDEYVQIIYAKTKIIESISNPAEIEQNFKKKYRVLTLENVKQSVHSPKEFMVKQDKNEGLNIDKQKQECEALKSKVQAENPEFYNLLEEILKGDSYKIPALIKMVEKNKCLTSLQTEYLIRMYKIENVVDPENNNSSVLAILLLANEGLVIFMIKKIRNFYGVSSSIISKEDLEIIAKDSIRTAIDEFSLDLNYSLTTFAYGIFKNDVFKMVNSKKVQAISFDTPIFKGKDSDLVLEDSLGEEDQFITNYVENDFKSYVWGCLGYLKPRYQTIMMLYLGKYNEPMTNQQIADVVHLTKSRVSAITKTCFELMKEIVKEDKKVKSALCQDTCRLISKNEFDRMVKNFDVVDALSTK